MKTEIAIIGMGGIFPDALDLSEYWSNILAGKDSITEIPKEYWNIEEFYDPDPKAEDKTYSHKAALIEEVPFDSLEFGIPPKVMESISIDQLFGLLVAKQALLSANLIGPEAKTFNRDKTGVILSSSVGKSSYSLSGRLEATRLEKILRNSHVPEDLAQRVVTRWKNSELEWNEESEPGFLANVAAGRIASRFDLYGTNCVVDAACASSLAALKYAVHELENNECDIVLTGGITLDCTPFTMISFSKTPAISKKNCSRPFDQEADGMMLGDGVGMVVLKRLEDAKRDGDHIFAVIESMASSSDGKGKSIFAPHKKGQMKALQRAYQNTKISPKSVTMIEAHGTGTAAGDETELSALKEFFQSYDVPNRQTMIGSVKSQIGHTRMTAGVASMIKTAIALDQQVLPPTLHVKTPNRQLFDSPFYTLNAPKPWITNRLQPIRRAGVSSFGFGGTNYHVILREHTEAQPFQRWQKNRFGLYFSAKTQAELLAQLTQAVARLAGNDVPYFQTLVKAGDQPIVQQYHRLGFLAKDCAEAAEKLQQAIAKLEAKQVDSLPLLGIFYRSKAVPKTHKVATLFAGQGTQRVDMLQDAAVSYPEIREMFSVVDNVLLAQKQQAISERVYPRTLSGESKASFEEALAQTKHTQPALAAISGGLYRLLQQRGYKEDLMIGHSFGELSALWAAGALSDQDYATLAVKRGQVMQEEGAQQTGMLAVFSDKQTVAAYVKDNPALTLANENAPEQMVVSGENEALALLEATLKKDSIRYKRLRVSAAFHSKYMAQANQQFVDTVQRVKLKRANCPIIHNGDAQFYPTKISDMRARLETHMESPVRFTASIEQAYQEGARIFVEIGAGNTLSGLTKAILADKACEIIAVAPNHLKNATEQIETLLVQLKVLGLPVCSDPYAQPLKERENQLKTPTSYLLNSLQFTLPKTKERIDQAINDVDPKPEALSIALTKQPIKEETVTMTTHSEQEQAQHLPSTHASGSSVFEYAHYLQSVNGNVFRDFMEGQNQQLEAFSQLYQQTPQEQANHLLQFMNVFQANSMDAYTMYFKQQNALFTGEAVALPELKAAPVSMPAMPTRPAPQMSSVMTEVAPQPVMTQAPTASAPQTVETPAPVEEATEVVTGEILPIESTQGEKNILFYCGKTTQAEYETFLLALVSEITGYPEEMIDKEMNIESDLGIDSIKRVEIFSRLSDAMDYGFMEDEVEVITMLYTVSDIAGYLEKRDPSTLSGRELNEATINSMAEEMDLDEVQIAEVGEQEGTADFF